MDGLRELNILASQASEFKYNRNRTEGKTGLVKPDLIPAVAGVDGKNVSPKRLTNEAKSGEKLPPGSVVVTIKKPTPRSSPRTSPLHLIAEEAAKKEPVNVQAIEENPVNMGSAKETKNTTSTVVQSVADNAPQVEANSEQLNGKTLPAEEQNQHQVDNAKQSETLINSIETVDATQMNVLNSDHEPVNAAQSDKTIKDSLNQLPTNSIASTKAVADASNQKKPVVSPRSNGAPRPTLVRSKGSLIASKPPNILVYSESAATRDSVITTLSSILEENTYVNTLVL